MHRDGDWHMGGMGAWWLLTGLAVIAVAWFAPWAARGGADDRESPEQAPKRRDANGEIGRQTYEQILEDRRK